jgi:hypothetical protein
MHPRLSCWIAAALACGLAPSFAQPIAAPPAWPRGDPPPLVSDPVHPLKLGTVRVTLNANTLGEVQRALGVGEMTTHGKGTEALDWLCYTIVDGEAPQRLWLTSSELVGGGKIDGVTAIELGAGEKASPGCPELPARFRPVRFEDGLWLGTLSAEQRRAMGVPAHGTAAWSGLYHGTLGGLDVVGTMAVDVRRSRAVAIHVAKN